MPYSIEPVKPSFIRGNLNFEFDSHDRVQVISREWFVYRYQIAEQCDARAIPWRRPPAALPTPDQQPKDEVGQPPQKPLTAKEWLADEVERREKQRRENLRDIPKGITKFSVQLHSEMEKAAKAGVVKWVVSLRRIEQLLRDTTSLFAKKKRSPES